MCVRSHLYLSDTLLLSRSCADTAMVSAQTVAAKTPSDSRCVRRFMDQLLVNSQQHSWRGANATSVTRRRASGRRAWTQTGTNGGTNREGGAVSGVSFDPVEQPVLPLLFDDRHDRIAP